MAYTKAELQKLAAVLLKYPDLLILTDDIYEHIYWGKEPFSNIVMVCPELYNRTIVLNGVSKTYSMTGWRLGYAAGPAEIITVMKNIQSQSTSNPCSISQAAAVAALEGDQSFVKELRDEFKKRYDYLYQAFSTIDGFEIKPCDGAFYVFPSVQRLIERMPNINSDIEFAEFLLNEAKIATVPGTAFGYPGYIRFSYASDINSLKTAIERIKKALAGL